MPVCRFYETHPYPEPVDDVDAYRRAWNDERRRIDSHLFWPCEPYRDDRSILVAGCGTMQAAHYAVRWPRARVIGIDISAISVAFTLDLKRKHALDNLEVYQLAIERAAELDQTFEHIVCTGVLHHLPHPEEGLTALRGVMAPNGAMHLMVYAPYGRAGIYMLQDYCRRLGVGWTDNEVADLAKTLKALPADHPIVPLLRNSPDFANTAGMADALLHPQDRSYSVPELMELIKRAGLTFGRWLRQAPYLPQCGALATSPHALKLSALNVDDQFAAIELFRGTMTRHSLIAYKAGTRGQTFDFHENEWLEYVPIRLPDTIVVKDRLPPGSTAVLINQAHTYRDLYLLVNPRQEQLFARVNGKLTIGETCKTEEDQHLARDFFEQLWRWDQVVFDASGSRTAAQNVSDRG